MKTDMKLKITGVTAFLLLLLTVGCNGDLQEKLNELKERATVLEEQCIRFNGNLASLSGIVRAIQANDLITGVTSIKKDNVDVGYTINFLSASPIAVYDGEDGKAPYFSAKMDTDGSMYWTVRNGVDGQADWLLDEKGDKILAVGEIPYLSVSKDVWRYTLDGKTWVELGPAKGEDADTIFKKIDLSDSLFVLFHMSDGTVLKIPRYDAYKNLLEKVSKANDDIKAQRVLLETIFDDAVYIVSMEDIKTDGKKTGVKVFLSNGESFEIKDWVQSDVPVVVAEKDTSDGLFYWTCRYADEAPVWITDADGKRIVAVDTVYDVPVVSIEIRGGRFYWYVMYRDDEHYLLDTEGNRISLPEKEAFAADSVQYRIFRSVSYNDDYLEIFLNNGDNTAVKLMRQYAVSLASTPYQLTEKTLAIPDGKVDTVSYRVTGAQVRDIVVMTEGDLTAQADKANQRIIVNKVSGTGAVSFLFTFSEASSTNTKFIRLEVKQ